MDGKQNSSKGPIKRRTLKNSQPLHIQNPGPRKFHLRASFTKHIKTHICLCLSVFPLALSTLKHLVCCKRWFFLPTRLHYVPMFCMESSIDKKTKVGGSHASKVSNCVTRSGPPWKSWSLGLLLKELIRNSLHALLGRPPSRHWELSMRLQMSWWNLRSLDAWVLMGSLNYRSPGESKPSWNQGRFAIM